MILPMNHHFYPYRGQVVPYLQHGKGGISVFGGSSPYGQGGNGLGGLFRGLVRTATPFLKTTAKKVGKRLLQTGLDTGMQIIGDVMNGKSLKKSVKTRAKTAGKDLVAGTLSDLTQQQGRGRPRGHKRKRKAVPVSSTQTKRRRTSPATFKTIFD
nr:TPA_asm: cupiennin [Rhodactis coral adintovirus]